MTPNTETADELEILRLIARLAQAIDDRNQNDYRKCFADILLQREDNSWQPISSDDYARRAIDSVAPLDWTHHQTLNPLVTVQGDVASARTDVIVTLAANNEEGAPEILTLGGRYELEFARMEQGWRITRRHRTTRYTIGDPGLVDRAQQRFVKNQDADGKA